MQTSYNLDFYHSFKSGFSKFKSNTPIQKLTIFFWLLGPFLYLIELAPADIWLTVISITFIISIINLKNWNVK